MKSRFNKYLLSFCLILACTTAIGQEKAPPAPPSSKGNAQNNGNNSGHPGLPIDGGISILLVSGIAYGIYELKKKKPN